MEKQRSGSSIAADMQKIRCFLACAVHAGGEAVQLT